MRKLFKILTLFFLIVYYLLYIKRKVSFGGTMNSIKGDNFIKISSYSDLKNHDGEVISVKGYIHRIREMTGFSFVILRTARDVIQCV